MLTLHSAILCITFQLTISVDPCRTPDNQDGDCLPLNQCSSIFTLFQQKKISANSAFLHRSLCGFVSSYPKVCCPIETTPSEDGNSDLIPRAPKCGSELESKIWGGNKTSIDEFPWMALLMYQKNNELKARCGGFLISKRYVLTARHCLQPSLVRVRLGEWDTTTNPDCMVSRFGKDCAPQYLDVTIQEQIPHDGPGNVLQNDIALLRLTQDVRFNDFVKPICLPMTDDLKTPSFVGKNLEVAGWGKTEKRVSSPIKLKLQIPVISLSQCDRALRKFGDPALVSQNPICAGGEKGKDTCNGDSGGPLMHKTQEWYAIGIVSFGVNNPCGQENAPSIYVRVAGHIDWIVRNIKP